MTPSQIHDAAIAAGATLLGEGPVHYLFSAEQLAALLRAAAAPTLPPLPY